jgi:hypothetical protein
MHSKSALLGSLAHQAELAWGLGDRQHATRCAIYWLDLVQQLPMRFCSPAMLHFVRSVLQVRSCVASRRVACVRLCVVSCRAL